MALISLADFNAVLGKAEGRDKVARTCQFAARAVVGFTTLAAPTAGSSLASLEANARSVMTQLAGARRTHRWCKEIPVIQSIPATLAVRDPADRILELMQKIPLATFMIIDHFGQLKQWKILPGGKRSGMGTIQLGLKFFCLSNFFSALIQAKKAFSLRQREDKASDFQKAWHLVVKHALIVLQTLHLSLTYQTHDAIVGCAGVISSIMDVIPQLPEKKVVAKTMPAANSLPKPEEKAANSQSKPEEKAA